MVGVTNPQMGLATAWIPPSFFPQPQPLNALVAVALQLGDIFLFQQVP